MASTAEIKGPKVPKIPNFLVIWLITSLLWTVKLYMYCKYIEANYSGKEIVCNGIKCT
jgi:hypothetical protein